MRLALRSATHGDGSGERMRSWDEVAIWLAGLARTKRPHRWLGKRRALEIQRHHRLLERFLHDVLDFSWDEVHDEAERLEHYISERLEDRIAAKLGDPETDPHGHIIPEKNGIVVERQEVALSKWPCGVPAVSAAFQTVIHKHCVK